MLDSKTSSTTTETGDRSSVAWLLFQTHLEGKLKQDLENKDFRGVARWSQLISSMDDKTKPRDRLGNTCSTPREGFVRIINEIQNAERYRPTKNCPHYTFWYSSLEDTSFWKLYLEFEGKWQMDILCCLESDPSDTQARLVPRLP